MGAPNGSSSSKAQTLEVPAPKFHPRYLRTGAWRTFFHCSNAEFPQTKCCEISAVAEFSTGAPDKSLVQPICCFHVRSAHLPKPPSKRTRIEFASCKHLGRLQPTRSCIRKNAEIQNNRLFPWAPCTLLCC